MQKHTILGVSIITLVVTSLFAVGYYQWRSGVQKVQNPNIQQTSSSTSSGSSVLSATNGNTPSQIQKQDDTNSSNLNAVDSYGLGGGLQTNDPNSSQVRQQPSQTVPGPESFGQYEEYKDEQNMRYLELVTGQGNTAQQGKKVAVLYKGWLTDGTLFDQSRKDAAGKLQPFVLTLGARQVIAGWEAGLEGMKVGGMRRLIIPPTLGYGVTGQGPIPPNAVLVFDVEVVDVQ